MPSENTRRIAKNTGFLYVRMLLTMGVAFPDFVTTKTAIL